MKRMGTFFKYALWIIAFFIFSNFLIEVGLNSNYKKIERKDELSEVSIYQAEATKVNGRIRGFINNPRRRINREIYKIRFLFRERCIFR